MRERETVAHSLCLHNKMLSFFKRLSRYYQIMRCEAFSIVLNIVVFTINKLMSNRLEEAALSDLENGHGEKE